MEMTTIENNQENQMNIVHKNFHFEGLDNLRRRWMSKQNIYINYFYFFINNHYESIINNVNFFHYATEALIWELFKNDTTDYEGNFKLLTGGPINIFAYCNNIKLLTGTSHHCEAETKLSELQLAKLFHERFNIYRTTLEEGVNDFREAFKTVTCRTVSSCLMNLARFINKEFTDIDDLLFFDAFKQIPKDKITLFNFIKILEKSLGRKIEKDEPFMIFVKNYYFYVKTSYADYLFDLELFYDHSMSLLDRIKKLTNYNNINNYVTQSKAYQQLKIFYSLLAQYVIDKKAYVQTKMIGFKIWVNDSIRYCPSFFKNSYNTTKVILYERIIAPSKNFIVLYTDKSVTFILTNLSNVEAAMKEISSFLLEKAELFMESLQEQVNEKDLFIRFTSDEKVNYLKVDIDNSVLMFNPTKFKEYVKSMYGQLKEYSNKLIEDSRMFFMDKYKIFLSEH
jgi:hypothetical protein